MKRFPPLTALLTAFCILMCGLYASAQGLSTAKPETAGMSSDRLSRIAPLMQQYVDENQIPGCVTLVARKGKVVHLETFGYSDVESKTPIQRDTIMRLASMTKPVTSVAGMILYEEGKFLLDDPVSKYLPEFSDMKVLIPSETDDNAQKSYEIVDVNSEILVRHLFNHTAGLSAGNRHLVKMYREAKISNGLPGVSETIGDMVQRIAELPLANHPGEEWVYGLSHDILGYFIEVVSGMPFDEFLNERIFKPLAMKDSYFYPPEDKLDRVGAIYFMNKNGEMKRLPDKGFDNYFRGARSYFSGGGGLCTTITDYARFCQMLLNGGELEGVRILSRKSVELMTTDSTGGMDILVGTGDTRATHGDRYGLGFGIRAYPGDAESIGSYGWGGAYNAFFWIDPKEDLFGIFLSHILRQRDKSQHRKFRMLTYQAIIE